MGIDGDKIMTIARIGKVYKHFKGNLYKVLLIAKNADTLEKEVVYVGLYEPYEIYTRPKKEFEEQIKKGGIFRFEEVYWINDE